MAAISPGSVGLEELAGEKVVSIVSRAPGNGAHLGGIKVATAGGWFAARPSGTENIFKIYAESFHGTTHLRRLQDEAQLVVAKALSGPQGHSGTSGPVGEPGAESRAVRAQRGFRVGAGTTYAAQQSP